MKGRDERRQRMGYGSSHSNAAGIRISGIRRAVYGEQIEVFPVYMGVA